MLMLGGSKYLDLVGDMLMLGGSEYLDLVNSNVTRITRSSIYDTSSQSFTSQIIIIHQCHHKSKLFCMVTMSAFPIYLKFCGNNMCTIFENI
jgi:hypothetical protein